MMYFILALIYGLYMLRGDIMFMCFNVFIVFYFTYGTLIIDLYYEVIHGICLVVFCEIKKLIWFTYIFHTSIYAFV